jgi:hypothetical protein
LETPLEYKQAAANAGFLPGMIERGHFDVEEPATWRERLRYWWYGRSVRTKACELAAVVLSTRKDEDSLAPLAFSLAVFFETYIWSGSEATKDDFGPKEPVELSVVSDRP